MMEWCQICRSHVIWLRDWPGVCNKQRHLAVHCPTLQHAATHCKHTAFTLQHHQDHLIAGHPSIGHVPLIHISHHLILQIHTPHKHTKGTPGLCARLSVFAVCCGVLRCFAARCNVLQVLAGNMASTMEWCNVYRRPVTYECMTGGKYSGCACRAYGFYNGVVSYM